RRGGRVGRVARGPRARAREPARRAREPAAHRDRGRRRADQADRHACSPRARAAARSARAPPALGGGGGELEPTPQPAEIARLFVTVGHAAPFDSAGGDRVRWFRPGTPAAPWPPPPACAAAPTLDLQETR